MNASIHHREPRRPTIACVNSSHDLLEMIRTLLEDEGYEAIALPVELETEQRIASLQPDAMIIDLVSTNSESWELLRQIRSNEATRNLPCAVISTDRGALESIKNEPDQFRVDHVLAKPFDIYDLCSIVHQLVHAVADEGR